MLWCGINCTHLEKIRGTKYWTSIIHHKSERNTGMIAKAFFSNKWQVHFQHAKCWNIHRNMCLYRAGSTASPPAYGPPPQLLYFERCSVKTSSLVSPNMHSNQWLNNLLVEIGSYFGKENFQPYSIKSECELCHVERPSGWNSAA